MEARGGRESFASREKRSGQKQPSSVDLEASFKCIKYLEILFRDIMRI